MWQLSHSSAWIPVHHLCTLCLCRAAILPNLVCSVFIYWVFSSVTPLCIAAGRRSMLFKPGPVITFLRDASHRRGPRHSGKGWPWWRDAALWFGSTHKRHQLFCLLTHASLASSYTPSFSAFAFIHQLCLAQNPFCLHVWPLNILACSPSQAQFAKGKNGFAECEKTRMSFWWLYKTPRGPPLIAEC